MDWEGEEMSDYRLTPEEARRGKLPEWVCRKCRETFHPSMLEFDEPAKLGICAACRRNPK